MFILDPPWPRNLVYYVGPKLPEEALEAEMAQYEICNAYATGGETYQALLLSTPILYIGMVPTHSVCND